MKQSPDFSLRGAVDLGARQAAAQRRQQAAQAPDSGGQTGYVIDVTDESFNADVVDRSRSVPVIMDLWAEWCGPCKQLSPVLEKLAAEAEGAWVLAKVDVDANPQLSAALQVQSIPMVVAVLDGQLVPGFLGALPESDVREWIGQVLQVAAQLGLPGPEAAAPPADAEPEDAERAAGQAPGRPRQARRAGRRPARAVRARAPPGRQARRAAGDRGRAAAVPERAMRSPTPRSARRGRPWSAATWKAPPRPSRRCSRRPLATRWPRWGSRRWT